MTQSDQANQNPKFFCPLFNFRIYEPKNVKIKYAHLNFISNTTIGKIGKRDLKNKMLTKLILEEHIAGAFYNKYEDLTTIEIYQEKDTGIVFLVESILLALRLYKEGDIFIKVILDEKYNSIIILNPTYEMPNTIHSTIYSLGIDEIQQVNNLFQKLTKADLNKRRPLKIACDRLNRAYGKSMYDEKIIDFMIALEALYTKEHSANSGSIIATSCSVLLGKNDKERTRIYNFLKEMYKLRNDIVHGSSIDLSNIDKKTSQLKEYLKKSIIALL